MTALISKRECLRLQRLKKGFTQEGLAQVVGVSKEHIKSLEYGRVNPSFSLMMKLCETLNVKAEDIF